MPSYPSYPSIPYKPQTEGFGVSQFYNPPRRSEMNLGTNRVRRVDTIAIAKINFHVLMNSSDIETLMDFVVDTLSHGSSKFTMSVWRFNQYVTKTCLFVDGTPDVGTKEHYDANDAGKPVYPVNFSLLVENYHV